MDHAYVPTISMAGFESLSVERKQALSDQIDAALQRSGFFVCADHAVPQAVLERLRGNAYRFFDQPLEVKLLSRSTVTGSPRGFIPFGAETLAKTEGKTAPPDIKEGYGVGPYWVDETAARSAASLQGSLTGNRWPDGDDGFKAAVLDYYREMEGLTLRLMELFALGMKLPANFFVDKFQRHNSTLRMIHYPAQDTPPAHGQLRAGAHTDYGALTILMAEDRLGGLEVRLPDGRWQAVTPPPGAFVINIGDLMMNWSNDKWLSNAHRVVNPPAGAGPAARRLSVGYFCNPQDDLLIECIPTCCSSENPPRYPAIPAGEHRLRKIRMSLQPASN